MKVDKWEYTPLITVLISILSLGRPGIHSIKLYVVNSSSLPVIKNFSPIWFLVVPILAFLWKNIAKNINLNVFFYRLILIGFILINIILTFTFLPESELYFYEIMWFHKELIVIFISKFLFNLYIFLLLVRGYASSKQDLYLLHMFRITTSPKSRITNDHKYYIQQQNYCVILCYISAIILIVVSFFLWDLSIKYKWIAVSFILSLVGILRFGNIKYLKQR